MAQGSVDDSFASVMKAAVADIQLNLACEHQRLVAKHLGDLQARLCSVKEALPGVRTSSSSGSSARSGSKRKASDGKSPSSGSMDNVKKQVSEAISEAIYTSFSEQGSVYHSDNMADSRSPSSRQQQGDNHHEISPCTPSDAGLGSDSLVTLDKYISNTESDGKSDQEPASSSAGLLMIPSGQMSRRASSSSKSTNSSSYKAKEFKVLELWTKVSSPKILKHTKRFLDRTETNSTSGSLTDSESQDVFVQLRSLASDSSSEDSDSHSPRILSCILQLISYIMIPPSSSKHFMWNFIGVLAIVYDSIWIPVRLLMPPHLIPIEVAAWTVRVYWTLNIFASFIMGYWDHRGVQVMSLKKVARRYARTWLTFDIIVVAVDWIELYTEDSHSTLSFGDITTFLVLIRLLRVGRLWLKVRHLHKNIRNEGVNLSITISKVIFVMLFLTHLTACLWYGIGLRGNHEESWVKANDIQQQPLADRYAWSFHCAISLLTGDHVVLPRSVAERVFCSSVLFVTLLISAWFVSSITTAMTRLHILASQKSSQFSALKRYLMDNKISSELASKVQRNARYALSEQERYAPESSIELLHIISDPLRSELHYEVHSPVLLYHPFFRCYAEISAAALRKICHTALSRLNFGAGDVVFAEGEAPAVPKMYIVAKGKLLYCQDECRKTAVHKGDWLSEAVLWTDWSHLGALTAGVDVHMLTLDAHRFQNIVVKFPSSQVRSYAVAFVAKLADVSTDLTDVGSMDSEDTDELFRNVFPELREVNVILRPSRSSIFAGHGHKRSSLLGGGKRISTHTRDTTSSIISRNTHHSMFSRRSGHSAWELMNAMSEGFARIFRTGRVTSTSKMSNTTDQDLRQQPVGHWQSVNS